MSIKAAGAVNIYGRRSGSCLGNARGVFAANPCAAGDKVDPKLVTRPKGYKLKDARVKLEMLSVRRVAK